MALTREQFQKLRDKGLTVEQILEFESGQSPEVKRQTAGNQFAAQPSGLLNKALNFATSIIGGGKLAEGLGMGMAAPEVQRRLTEAEQFQSDTELAAVKRINEKKARGEDTSKLEAALRQLRGDKKVSRDAQTDFTEALPTDKEVIGSAVRLGATAAAPILTRTIAKRLALGKPATAGSGALRGAGAGAAIGVTEGALHGAGVGLEQNLDAGGVALSAAGGAALGGLGGAVLGGAGGAIGGAINRVKDPNKALELITPSPTDFTPTQYRKLVTQGRIIPKTSNSPAHYVLSEAERTAATKYPDVIAKDPVQTTLNINDKIGTIDDDVGAFLRQNNGIFSKGELRNAINAQLGDLTDVTIDEARIDKLKSTLVDNFVKKLETNDMETLWVARKDFDQAIDNAFKGSPTLQKEVKVAFRNAVQDFIADRTPNGQYRAFMKDMTHLFRLRDLVSLKAAKERQFTSIGKWLKDHPKTAKAVGWGSLIGTGALGAQFLNPFGGGSGGNSSGG